MYTQRSKYWPAYTWKVQTSYFFDIKEKIVYEFKISNTDFEKNYFDIFDKINSSFYHLERLKENEGIAVQMGKELAKIQIPGIEGMVGIAGAPYEPIVYEYESFLVTIKSTLDFIAILLAKGFNRREDNIVNFFDGIKSRNAKPDSLEGKMYALFNRVEFVNLFNEYRNPDKDQKSKRNFAAHKGSLPIGTINIPINNPGAPTLLSKALNPNVSKPYLDSLSSQNLIEYCEGQFYQTCDLLIETLSLITNTQLKPGPKNSIYKQKLEK